jgi:hypothetical protein
MYKYVKSSRRRIQKVHFETDVFTKYDFLLLGTLLANRCHKSDPDQDTIAVGFIASTPTRNLGF